MTNRGLVHVFGGTCWALALIGFLLSATVAPGAVTLGLAAFIGGITFYPFMAWAVCSEPGITVCRCGAQLRTGNSTTWVCGECGGYGGRRG